MSPPKFNGDVPRFLRDWAVFAHERHGLHAGRDLERCAEAWEAVDAVHALELSDLHEQLEDLERQVRDD